MITHCWITPRVNVLFCPLPQTAGFCRKYCLPLQQAPHTLATEPSVLALTPVSKPFENDIPA